MNKFVTTTIKVGNIHFSCRFQINYICRFRHMRHLHSLDKHFWDGWTDERRDRQSHSWKWFFPLKYVRSKICLSQNMFVLKYVRPKYVGPKLCWSQKMSVPKYVRPKTCLSQNMFVPKYIRPKIRSSQNMFVPKYVRPKICSSQNMFVPKHVCPKICSSQNMSVPVVHLVPNEEYILECT